MLTTSAFHMPRAMVVARRIGWNLIPWPTDYRTRPGGRPLADSFEVLGNLSRSEVALHEELGLIAYRMRDMGGAAASAPPPSNAAAPGALSNAPKESAAP